MSIKYLLGFGKRRRGNLNWNTVTRLTTLFPNSASAAIEADIVFFSPTFRIAGKTTASFVGLSTTYGGTAPTYLLGASIEGLAPVSFGLLTASYTAPSNYDAAYISVTIYDPTNSDIDLSTALGVDYEVEVGYASGAMQLATDIIMGYIGNFYSAGSQQNVITFGVDDYSATYFIAGAGFARVKCLNDNWNTAGITVGISVALFKDTKHIFAYSNTSVINGNAIQSSGGSPSLGSTAADYSLHVGAFSGDASANPVASSPTIASTSIAGTSFDQMIAYDPTPGSLTVDWTESSGNDYQVHTARVIGLSYNYFDISGSSTTNFVGSSTAGITDYPLVADTANFSLTGQVVPFSRDYISTAANKAYNLTGQAVLTKVGHVSRAVNKAYTLAGQLVDISLFNRLLIATSRAYNLTGQAITLNKGFISKAASVAYNITGQVVLTKVGHISRAVSKAYNLSGTVNRIKVGFVSRSLSKTYVLAGQVVLLKRTYISTAISKAYNLTGQIINWIVPNRMIADSATFILNRTPALLKASRLSQAVNKVYTLAGQGVLLKYAITVLAATRAYGIIGQNVLLRFTRISRAINKAYTLAGQVANFARTKVFQAPSSTYTLVGSPVDLDYSGFGNFPFPLSNGSFTFSGTSVTITKSYPIIASSGSFYLGRTNRVDKVGRVMRAANKTYALTGFIQNFLVNYTRYFILATRSFALTGQNVGVIDSGNRSLIAETANFILTRTDANLKIPAKIVAVSRSYTLTRRDIVMDYSGTSSYVMPTASATFILTRTPSSVVRSRVIYDSFIPRYRLNKPLYIIGTEPVTGASNSNRRGNIIAGGLH